VIHDICDCDPGVATVTVHPVAVYKLGDDAGPYDTFTNASFTPRTVEDTGPNSYPINTTVCPPFVFAFTLPTPDSDTSDGAAYDVVATDAPLL